MGCCGPLPRVECIVPHIRPAIDGTEAVNYRFCPGCGAYAPSDASFCGECGRSLNEQIDAAEFDSQQTEIDLGTGADPLSKQSDHQEAPRADDPQGADTGNPPGPPIKKRRNRLILVAIVMVLILSGGIVAAAMNSGSNNSSPHSGTGTTTTTAQINGKTNALKAFLLDNQGCSSLAQDMQQGASGRIDYAEATSFSTEADTALKYSSTAASLANAATTFLRQFQDSSAGPDNINLYPTAAVVSGCAVFKVAVPLIPNGSTSTTAPPTTTTPPSTSAISAVTSLVEQQGFPASEITVTIDNNDPSWAMWVVNDPSNGTGYGFAELIQGWEIVAGIGSSGVGCPGGGQGQAVVPPQVMTYFGTSCPASGNSGSTGSSGNT